LANRPYPSFVRSADAVPLLGRVSPLR